MNCRIGKKLSCGRQKHRFARMTKIFFDDDNDGNDGGEKEGTGLFGTCV